MVKELMVYDRVIQIGKTGRTKTCLHHHFTKLLIYQTLLPAFSIAFLIKFYLQKSECSHPTGPTLFVFCTQKSQVFNLSSDSVGLHYKNVKAPFE